MSPQDQQKQLDGAFDRIEETILLRIGMLLNTLMNASEQSEMLVSPQAYAAELLTLALQVEALTREIEAVSPARIDPGVGENIKSARG